MKKVRVNISIDPDTHERLKQYAFENHTTVSAAITDWIWSAKVKDEKKTAMVKIVRRREGCSVKRVFVKTGKCGDTFYECGDALYRCGDTVSWMLDDNGVLTISGEGKMEDYFNLSDVPWRDCRKDITSVVIAEGVASVGNGAFAMCNNLTSVSLPASLTSIGENAFCQCTALTRAVIPESVTGIGGGAFANCTSLVNIALPDGVVSVGMTAFRGIAEGSTIHTANPDLFTNCFNYSADDTSLVSCDTEGEWVL